VSLVRFTTETPLVSQSTRNITLTKLADLHDGDDVQEYLTVTNKLLAKRRVNRGSITALAHTSFGFHLRTAYRTPIAFQPKESEYCSQGVKMTDG
jgi:hypothetical protein